MGFFLDCAFRMPIGEQANSDHMEVSGNVFERMRLHIYVLLAFLLVAAALCSYFSNMTQFQQTGKEYILKSFPRMGITTKF